MIQTSEPVSKTRSARVIRFELAPMTLLIILAGVAALWLVVKILPALLVLIMAMFIVSALDSTIQLMEKHGFNRTTAIALVFFTLLLVLAAIAFMAIRPFLAELSDLSDQIPLLRSQLADLLSDIPFGTSLAQWVRDGKYAPNPSNIGTIAINYSLRVVEIITYALVAIFMALYIMIERDRLRGGLFSLVPRGHHVRLSRILLNLETIVGAYIRGQLLTSSLIAVFTFTLLSLVGAENAIFFGLVAGVADVLPYLGVLLSVGPAVFAALPQGFSATIIVLLSMLAYEEFESRILIPHVYGKQLRLPASIVLFSILIGSILMGAAGALLSLPIAAAIMMFIEELRVQLPGENEPMVKEKLRQEDDRAEKEYERQTVGITTEKSAAIAVKIAEEKLKDESVSHLKNGGHP